MYIKSSSIAMESNKSEFYYQMFNPWIQQCQYNNAMRQQQGWEPSIDGKFDTWMYDFMVRNNFSMSMVMRCVSREQLFQEFVNGNQIGLERCAHFIRQEKERLIRENEEDEYYLSFRENEETEDW